MTRTISLIIGIAVVALAAVPTALGTPSPGEQVDAVKFFYANERATVPFPAATHDHGDATQAKLVQSPTIGIVRDHGDATQAKLVQSPTIGIVRDAGDATQAKLARLSSPVVVHEQSLRSLGRPDRVDSFPTAASHYTPQDVQRMSDSYAARGGDLGNVPSSSYYLPQQIETMSQGWAARGRTGSETVPPSGDGGDIGWSQIGIGFGLGLLLAIGLGLSLKATRPRTLAH